MLNRLFGYTKPDPSYPCSTAAAVFSRLAQSTATFQLALDTLLPALDPPDPSEVRFSFPWPQDTATNPPLSGNIPGTDESGTACNADGTLMTAPANNYVFAEPAISAGLSKNPAVELSSSALAISPHTVGTSAGAGPSHQHKAKRGPGRQPPDLNWEVYDDKGNAISAREFAVQYTEQWEERFANTYDHLL
ncbi:hypothetical protein GGX14DRAFT_576964 [Mycena pura]|uniref:Uncharacterized protein n=1 Tax=Mycena pura TaxID=153505 RepID=A0AAD6UWP4_9AGAR|nr:hypothetical protein GGX14DRAFT_576964 [Mycena pura]